MSSASPPICVPGETSPPGLMENSGINKSTLSGVHSSFKSLAGFLSLILTNFSRRLQNIVLVCKILPQIAKNEFLG